MTRTFAIVRYGFLGVGVLLLAGAALSALHTRAFLSRAVTATGTVVDLSVSRSTDGGPVYKPVVAFVAEDGARIQFVSSSGHAPPAHHRGEVVAVRYDPADPHAARIDAFFDLWGMTVVPGLLGACFLALGGGLVAADRLRRRRAEWLRRHGARIETAFQSVEVNRAFEVNGRHPFRIVTQWLNPATREVHLFQSENLWFDPTELARDRRITVFVDRRDLRRYHVDVSFLPRLAA